MMTDTDLARSRDLATAIESLQGIYYGAGERPKARLALALLAIIRLGGVNAKYSRREIFAPLASEKKKDPKPVLDESLSKDWQRKFLDKLKADQLISNNPANLIVSPEPSQKDALLKIIDNTLNGDGIQLKSMLWPSQYPTDDPLASEELQEAEEAVVPEEVSASQGSEFDVVKEIAVRMEGIQNHLSTVVEHLDQLYRQLSSIGTSMELNLQSSTETVNKLEKVLGAIQNDNRLKVSAILDRLLENETRKKTLISQLSSEANRDDKLATDLKNLLERT